MKKLLITILLTIALHFSVFSSPNPNLDKPTDKVSQEIEVRGKVVDESGTPLPGASLLEVGTTNGVVADFDGNFVIRVQKRGSPILVSYIGFEDQTILANQNYVEIQLIPSVTYLEETVVIGYGSIKKSDLTGSIASISSDDLNQFPTADPVQALQGRASGVAINSVNGGEPGADYSIRIRGNTSITSSNDPLFVVDGFPQASLPPSDDIASVEILKDASATAIYGSRGANGVVLITTKKGKSGKMKVDLNISYASQDQIKRYKLLNAQEYGEYMNELDALAGSPATFPNISGLGLGVDWQEEISQTGEIQNYNLSVSGGNDQVTYYVSGTVFDQRGVVLNSDYNRYSITSNVNAKLTDRLNIGVNLFARRTESSRVSTREGTPGSQGGGLLTSALVFPPTLGIFEADGIAYSLDPFQPLSDNPIATVKERTDDFISDYLQSSIFGEYKILKNLKFKSVLGTTIFNDFTGTYQSSKLVYGGSKNGLAGINNSKRTNLLSENYLTYTLNFNDKHELTFLGGFSYQKFEKFNSSARSSGFLTDSSLYFNLGSASLAEQSHSNFEDATLISYYGRINYGFKNKYLLTATVRRDGSSVLAEGNEWDIFPSAALGWNVHEEEFLSASNTFSQLKFRLSYGVSGNNQSVQPYSSLARFRTVGAVYNGIQVNAVSPQSLSNRGLEWERTAQGNIGFDLGLFNSKVSLVGDYYDMTTSKLLFSAPIPRYLGVGDSALKNIGETGNKGFEVSIGVKDIIKTIHWNTNFNISSNKNTVKKLPDGKDILYQSGRPGNFVGINNTQILTEGEPIGLFYGYVYDGVQQSGDVLLTGAEGIGGEKFQDLVVDGILNSDDRTIIGDPNPDFHWGWNNSFNYKGIDLNIFLQGVEGNDILNYTRLWLEDGVGRRNASSELLNRWTPTNTNTDVPNASITRKQSLSTRWIEDGSYIRLKDVTLGYSLPEEVVKKIKVSSLRLYVSGQNLWTKTDYSGFDPEVGRGGDIEAIGVDFGSYPNTRNISLGMNLSF